MQTSLSGVEGIAWNKGIVATLEKPVYAGFFLVNRLVKTN